MCDPLVMSDNEAAAFLAPMLKPRASVYRGVTRTRNGKFQAQIRYDGKLMHLGTYDREEDAADKFDRKAFELRGTHTQFNFPARVYAGMMRVNRDLA